MTKIATPTVQPGTVEVYRFPRPVYSGIPRLGDWRVKWRDERHFLQEASFRGEVEAVWFGRSLEKLVTSKHEKPDALGDSLIIKSLNEF